MKPRALSIVTVGFVLSAAPSVARAEAGVPLSDAGDARDAAAPLPKPAKPTIGAEVNVSAPTYGTTSLMYERSAACGPVHCLVTWVARDGSYAMPLDADGKPLLKAARKLQGDVGMPAVVATGGAGAEEFVVASHVGGDVILTRFSSTGEVLATKSGPFGAQAYEPMLAWNGTHFLVVAVDYAAPNATLRALRFDANLKPVGAPTTLDVSKDGYNNTALVVSGTGFAVFAGGRGWVVGDDGAIAAGPIALPAAFSSEYVVSAGGVPVGYESGAGTLYKFGPNLDVVAKSKTSISSEVSNALAWNGTHLLVATSKSPGGDDRVAVRRFGLDLAPVDDGWIPIAPSGASRPGVVGHGGEFMLLPFRNDVYTVQEFGLFSVPLNAGGRARATTETLVSVTALTQTFPIVVAQPGGFLALVSQGEFEAGLLPLGPDGRPSATRPPSAISSYRQTIPIGLGTNPAGGTGFITSAFASRISRLRFDQAGHPLELILPEYPYLQQTSQIARGGVTWTGASWLWARDVVISVVGVDGKPASPMNWDGVNVRTPSLDTLGATTVIAYLQSDPNDLWRLMVAKLDATGNRIGGASSGGASSIVGLGSGEYHTTTAIAHDPAGFEVAWSSCDYETNFALTCEIRVAHLDGDGSPSISGQLILRHATGAAPPAPPPNGFAVPPSYMPLVAFDGGMYWVAWQEPDHGVWMRRLAPTGEILDDAPIKVLDEPVLDYGLASRGDGAVLMVYDRPDPAADVQAIRLKARMMGVGVPADPGDAGVADGAGSAGAGGGTGGGGTSGGGTMGGASGAGGGAAAGTNGTRDGGADAASANGGSSGGGATGGGGSGSSGCGCELASNAPARSWLGGALLVALALRGRRRSRRWSRSRK